jgi:universal stress protein A
MSIPYKHILLATDLLTETAAVADKAKQLADLYQARLSAIHIVESVPLYFGNELVLPETQEIERQLLERAGKKMAELTQSLAIPQEQGVVEGGITKSGLIDFAKKNDVDLIVIGSHSRHGIEHLLGSTARALANAAPCDVLAVRLKHEAK